MEEPIVIITELANGVGNAVVLLVAAFMLVLIVGVIADALERRKR